MAFCPKCGKELSENEVCTCQHILDSDIHSTTNNFTYKKYSVIHNKKYFKNFGLILMFVIVAILLIINIVTGYQKPITKFEKGYNNNDVETILNACFPNSYIQILKEESLKNDQYWSETISQLEELMDLKKQSMKDTYGRNLNLTIKILNKQNVDENEWDLLETYYHDTDSIIQKAYKLKVKITLEGRKDKKIERRNIYVVKFKDDSSWKLCLKGSNLNMDGLLWFSESS